MTRVELVIAKAEQVRGRLARIRTVLSRGRDAFLADEGLVEQVAFNVLLAIQESVDLASHIIANERWGVPPTLAALFDVLHEHGVLSLEVAASMRRGTKLRNLIAHGYVAIEPGRLHDGAVTGLSEIQAFLEEVLLWADRGTRAGE